MKARPNILWLMSDQHNANCLGVAGHPDVRTPNLDRIAASGAFFNHAYCNNPICGPSRCSFLSGQYVKTHGVSGNFIREVKRDVPNLARRFKENGYETALIGKAHLPYQWVEDGFDYIRLSDLCDAEIDNPASCHYFNDLIQAGLADQYDQGFRPSGVAGHGLRAFISELPEEYSLEAWTGRNAVEFLEQRDLGKPFFLKVSFQRPHDPYAPPAERMGEYDPELLSLPDNACDYLERGFAGKPEFQQKYVSGKKGEGYPFRAANADELRRQMAAHFTLITMMDDAIGEVLRTLDRQGVLNNTIIAYVTDHGDFAGEHGLVLKNLGIYESIHRIPFILAGPSVPEGKVLDAIVESVDLYPTLVELAGVTGDQVDGVSLVPVLESEAGCREYTVCEWDFLRPQSRVYAVRDAQYRLVYYDEMPDDGELYDHASDSGELINLFHDDRYLDIRSAFMEKLESYRIGSLRVHGWPEDELAMAKVQNKRTVLVHQRGIKWSEVISMESSHHETQPVSVK